MKYIFIFFIAIVTVFSSCKKKSFDEEITPVPVPVDSVETLTPEQVFDKVLMLKLVNEQRVNGCNCGTTYMPPVPPLVYNDILNKVAFAHSKEMNRMSQFGHTIPNGLGGPGDRAERAGYIGLVGENIAYGYATEEIVMRAWLGSQGHCKNIMSADFKEIGVGKDWSFWTMCLGSRY